MHSTENSPHILLLREVFGTRYQFDRGEHHIVLRPRDVARFLGVLKSDLGFNFLSDLSLVSTSGHPNYSGSEEILWDVTLDLFNLENYQRIHAHIFLGQGERLPDLEELYPGVKWRFDRSLRARNQESQPPLDLPQVRSNPNLSEAPYPDELHQWYLFDLTHPLTRHQWELAVEVYEGRILRTVFQTGYWSRNLEAKARELNARSFAPVLDVLLPSAAPLTSIAWAKTLEDYFFWQIPERAQALRMVFIELSRINSHLEVMVRIAEELAIPEAFQLGTECRERFKLVFDFYAGARVTTYLAVCGGLPHEPPAGWFQETFSLLRLVDTVLLQYRRLILQHPFARRRLQMAGISAQDALATGISGPVLRASGVNVDLRKSCPFYFYRDVEFDVPVGVRGEAYDRLLVLLEEAHQSSRILWQLLDNLPLGEVLMHDHLSVSFNQSSMGPAEWRGLISVSQRPWCSHSTALEGPQGEFGFSIVLHPEQMRLWSLKIKTPAAALALGLGQILSDCPIKDLGVALASLDLSPGALDL